jgi:hypothetical protein
MHRVPVGADSGHSAPDRTISGRELLDRGLTVALPLPLSSELVFIDDLQS